MVNPIERITDIVINEVSKIAIYFPSIYLIYPHEIEFVFHSTLAPHFWSSPSIWICISNKFTCPSCLILKVIGSFLAIDMCCWTIFITSAWSCWTFTPASRLEPRWWAMIRDSRSLAFVAEADFTEGGVMLNIRERKLIWLWVGGLSKKLAVGRGIEQENGLVW